MLYILKTTIDRFQIILKKISEKKFIYFLQGHKETFHIFFYSKNCIGLKNIFILLKNILYPLRII